MIKNRTRESKIGQADLKNIQAFRISLSTVYLWKLYEIFIYFSMRLILVL